MSMHAEYSNTNNQMEKKNIVVIPGEIISSEEKGFMAYF